MPHNKQLIPILDVYRLLGALIVVLVHYELIFGHFVILAPSAQPLYLGFL